MTSRLITCRNLVLAGMLSLVTASCSDENDTGGRLPEGKYPITFTTSVGELTVTRATTEGTWTDGEKVAIKINKEVKQYQAAADGTLSIAEGAPFYWQNTNDITVNAWYPYNNGTKPDLIVKANQNEGNNYQESDYLEVDGVSITFNNPQLTFKHRTAKVTVILEKGEGVSDVSDAAVTFLNQSGVENDGNEVTPKTETESGVTTYTALLVPQQMKDQQFIKVTLGGYDYFYTPTKKDDANLQEGLLHTYKITVKANGIDVTKVSSNEWTGAGEENIPSREVIVEYASTDVKKGDYIHLNGDISDGGLRKIYSDGTMLSEKLSPPANSENPVVGIVFWTPSETNSSGRITPANLADDKIMKAEFPNCTHGLAVSLKDVTYDGGNEIPWQYPYESVQGFQNSDNFTPANKNLFVSVASGIDNDNNINKILGYQNTQVLLAYNAYCNKNNKSDYIVKPVAAIAEFAKDATNNPAPSGSTGWFIPSAKELHLLCNKDVDDVCNSYDEDISNAPDVKPNPDSPYLTTRKYVDNSIGIAGGDKLDYNQYWSSTEYLSKTNTMYAIKVEFMRALVTNRAKFGECRVRAVCAF